MRVRSVFAVLVLAFPFTAFAQGPPPASVTVAKVEEGRLTPTAVRKGTVFFKEFSNLATEVDGIVEEVLFEEGEHFEAGAPMVRLDHVLVDAELEAAKALVSQYEAELEQEKTRLDRAKSLLKDEVTTPQEYDDIRFTVQSYSHRVDAAKADVMRLERQIAKKTIHAPFDGVVVDRQSELGEWKREGDTVAVFARDELFDVIVNLPEDNLRWVHPGLTVDMQIAGEALTGEFVTVIPRGDVTTRTFPVKIRVSGVDWLIESMSADVRMAVGEVTTCTMVPRDAIILDGNTNVVFVVQDGAATRIEVDVLGYDELRAGVQAEALAPGMRVITKGQERLRDSQPVSVVEPSS